MLLVGMRWIGYDWSEFDHVIKLFRYVFITLECVQVLAYAHHESMGHLTSEYFLAGWGYARGGLDPTVAHILAYLSDQRPTASI